MWFFSKVFLLYSAYTQIAVACAAYGNAAQKVYHFECREFLFCFLVKSQETKRGQIHKAKLFLQMSLFSAELQISYWLHINPSVALM